MKRCRWLKLLRFKQSGSHYSITVSSNLCCWGKLKENYHKKNEKKKKKKNNPDRKNNPVFLMTQQIIHNHTSTNRPARINKIPEDKKREKLS